MLIRVQTWQDGARIRHFADDNSVKLYNEQNVFRVETTMNRPTALKCTAIRKVRQDVPKERLPLRKGVAVHDKRYLQIMAESCRKQGIEIWAYYHVHLIAVSDTKEALADAIGKAHRRYTWSVNSRGKISLA
ncbi:MAG: hypothetical protein DDT21_02160 [Syntrophomonadaceae bacterium]|nr:hypothetical protein [Bacillota bacterium]